MTLEWPFIDDNCRSYVFWVSSSVANMSKQDINMWQMFSTVDRFSFLPWSVIEMYKKIMHALHVCTNTAGVS